MSALLKCRRALVAENLFLRKQLAFYREHQVRPRPLTDSARFSSAMLSRWFEWKDALVIVKPDTLIRWHRQGFRLFWRHKSRSGRPPLARELRALIVRMASENPTWGQARVANELSLKLGIKISPRTVRKYWPAEPEPRGRRQLSSQRWTTFIRNHAAAIVSCDFTIAVTAKFERLYVLVVLELGTWRILECNVTAHPTAEWTLQQLRHALPEDSAHRFLMHDRDSIFSAELPLFLCFGISNQNFGVLRADSSSFLHRFWSNVSVASPGFWC